MHPVEDAHLLSYPSQLGPHVLSVLGTAETCGALQTEGKSRDELKGRSPRRNPQTPVVQPLCSVTISTSANVLHLHLYLHSTFLLKFPF